MKNAAAAQEINVAGTMADPWGNGREFVQATVDIDGVVRVYDSVAKHYTRAFSASPATLAAYRSKAARKGWRFGGRTIAGLRKLGLI